MNNGGVPGTDSPHPTVLGTSLRYNTACVNDTVLKIDDYGQRHRKT